MKPMTLGRLQRALKRQGHRKMAQRAKTLELQGIQGRLKFP
jgi:hypothetical protein